LIQIQKTVRTFSAINFNQPFQSNSLHLMSNLSLKIQVKTIKQ